MPYLLAEQGVRSAAQPQAICESTGRLIAFDGSVWASHPGVIRHRGAHTWHGRRHRQHDRLGRHHSHAAHRLAERIKLNPSPRLTEMGRRNVTVIDTLLITVMGVQASVDELVKAFMDTPGIEVISHDGRRIRSNGRLTKSVKRRASPLFGRPAGDEEARA
jgi:hypothetical protein